MGLKGGGIWLEQFKTQARANGMPEAQIEELTPIVKAELKKAPRSYSGRLTQPSNIKMAIINKYLKYTEPVQIKNPILSRKIKSSPKIEPSPEVQPIPKVQPIHKVQPIKKSNLLSAPIQLFSLSKQSVQPVQSIPQPVSQPAPQPIAKSTRPTTQVINYNDPNATFSRDELAQINKSLNDTFESFMLPKLIQNLPTLEEIKHIVEKFNTFFKISEFANKIVMDKIKHSHFSSISSNVAGGFNFRHMFIPQLTFGINDYNNISPIELNKIRLFFQTKLLKYY